MYYVYDNPTYMVANKLICILYLLYLDGKLNTNVNIAELDSKHPDCYKSFYISAEIDDPKAFLNELLWPEGIYVRWHRPAEKMLNKDARNAEPRNGSSTSVNL